jgi:hypothetical protein
MFYIRAHNAYRSVNSLHLDYTKTNLLMLYTAKVTICYEIRTKHSTQSEHHVEFFSVKPGGT